MQQNIIRVVDRKQSRQALPQIFFYDLAVDLFGDAAALGVVEVFEDAAVGQVDAEEFAARGVVVERDLSILFFMVKKPSALY